MEHGLNGYTPAGLALRALAAALVVVASIAVKELALDSDPVSSSVAGTRVVEWSVDSELLDEELPVNVVIPPSARDDRGGRSLLVFLHGRGDDESTYLETPMYRALARQGGKAPLVAFPRGGPDSYWHDRDGGAWGSYVLEEVVPALIARFDVEPERVAIGGISMGGFGAFDIASRQPFELRSGGREDFCAVGGHSPAVWEQASETAPGAFDDEEDFAAHDVISTLGSPRSPLAGTRFWIDVGDDDPFAEAGEALADALRSGGAEGELVTGDGGHESSYWSSNWRRYMRFYAEALKECQVDGDRGGGSAPESDDDQA